MPPMLQRHAYQNRRVLAVTIKVRHKNPLRSLAFHSFFLFILSIITLLIPVQNLISDNLLLRVVTHDASNNKQRSHRTYQRVKHHAWAGLGFLSVLLALRIILPAYADVLTPLIAVLLMYIVVALVLTYLYRGELSEVGNEPSVHERVSPESQRSSSEKTRLKEEKKKAKAEVKKTKKMS